MFHLFAVALLILPTVMAWGAVEVMAPPPQVLPSGEVTRTIQKVTLANEVAYYTLTYDYTTRADRPGEATSEWWGWTVGFIPIGMTEPSGCNWYWQAFFNWTFDGEDLSKRPAVFRVVRGGGPDGMVEFAWDTPVVRAIVRFALTTGHDKLLMFGRYEPKVPVQSSQLRFSSYPGGFELPHNRAVTTAAGTWTAGETVRLDLQKERWFLLEDTSADLPRKGSAGLILGTPDRFSEVTIPVGDYGIVPVLTLRPEARRFAVALYDFPALPDYQQTREYFRKSADREAAALGQIADADWDQPLPSWPLDPARFARLRAQSEQWFRRGTEIWRPDPTLLPFDWARRLAGGPIRTTLFTPRYMAWETMELARRLDLQVQHLYWDTPYSLSQPDCWPYAGTTGQGPLPLYLAGPRAVDLASDDRAELFFVAGLSLPALPGPAREELLKRVAAGKGLLLVNPAGRWEGADTLRQIPDPDATRQLQDGLEWERIPGYPADTPPAAAYRYGQGRVVALTVPATTYGTLVPAHNESEGLAGITDHALALAARCALVSARRPFLQTRLLRTPNAPDKLRLHTDLPLPPGSVAVVRVMDDLDGVVAQRTLKLPLTGDLPLAPLPALRRHWIDVVVRDRDGHCLGFSFLQQPAAPRPALEGIALSPAIQKGDARIPRVDLPKGGQVTAAVRITGLTGPRLSSGRSPAVLDWEVWDAFGRLVARAVSPVPAAGGRVRTVLSLPRPVTVCHFLDLTLRRGDQILARQRQRFTMTAPYPYDDFTALMWSYAGGDLVLRVTDRKCYEWGAEMMDLCHVGGFEGDKAAREFWLSASSGLRLVPYVTRIAGSAEGSGAVPRVPCLHDPAYLEPTQRSLAACCRQAEPFCPAAYTLGDENYLYEGSGEPCNTPHTMAAFRQWLRDKYGTLAALNEAWTTHLADFEAITQPMTLGEALKQTQSFAPWLDHRLFMETAFAATHERFMDTIRTVDPQAKVGWDGFLGWGPRSGYDFRKLTARLQLNQTYTVEWLQGEMVRSFKRPDALTGKWGNSVADVEAGWQAFPWDCLLSGDNSVWWWTSWGCDYIPFHPDTSQSDFGKWFFAALRETTTGAGKLLLQAERMDSGVAVLHAQRNLFAGQLLAGMEGQASRAGTGDGGYLNELTVLLRGLRDCGIQYRVIAPDQLSGPPSALDACRVLFVPLAVCLSDAEADALREFVRRGGTLVVDGRWGLLDGNGRIRPQRPLEDVLGVRSLPGLEDLKPASPAVEVEGEGVLEGVVERVPLRLGKLQVRLLEPSLVPTTARPLLKGPPLLLIHRFGQGAAVTLNLDSSDGQAGSAPLAALAQERMQLGRQRYEALLAALLQAAGVQPFCRLETESGEWPSCVQQVFYRDGEARYLALMRDILVRGLPAEEVRVTLPEPAYVYDLRAGRRLGQGKLQSWTVKLDRGLPAVYALLPYPVEAVEAVAPASAPAGRSVTVQARIRASAGQASTHVIRLDVYPPGATTPHRQYSQNLLCRRGQGRAEIPLALNDSSGQWRLVFRDVATGVSTTRTLTVRRERPGR